MKDGYTWTKLKVSYPLNMGSENIVPSLPFTLIPAMNVILDIICKSFLYLLECIFLGEIAKLMLQPT